MPVMTILQDSNGMWHDTVCPVLDLSDVIDNRRIGGVGTIQPPKEHMCLECFSFLK